VINIVYIIEPKLIGLSLCRQTHITRDEVIVEYTRVIIKIVSPT
jgi:hypothetical protein